MTKYLAVIGIALVLAVSGGIGIARQNDSSPARVGAAAARVVPDAGQDLTSTITALQATLRRVPSDDTSWATLALAYVDQARITGVPSYYEKADQAVARSFSLRPTDNFAGLAASAAIAAARHDFSRALDLADRSLRINGRDLGALAIRVDALTELGRYDGQLRALRIADRRQPGTTIAARYSYAYELRGNLTRAATILRQAAEAGSRSDRAYLMTLLADIERREGRLSAAAQSLREAREAAPDYLPAMVSLARLHTARGDLAGSVRVWRDVVARLPLPEYLTELGELYTHLGRTALAHRQYDVVQSTVKLLAASGVNTDLESALYDADHGSSQRALVEARDEWRRRKSIHVADVLAWSLHQTGHDVRALRVSRMATSLGTPEAKLWIHRGTIEAALGRDAAARTHLRRGLTTDPGLSPWQRDRALVVLKALEGTK
jgi:tetratricopeptide (TPR) repeat protein